MRTCYVSIKPAGGQRQGTTRVVLSLALSLSLSLSLSLTLHTDSGATGNERTCCPRITQLKAQGPSRTCNESKEEEEGAALAEVPEIARDSNRERARER